MYRLLGFCIGAIMLLGTFGCSSVQAETELPTEAETKAQIEEEMKEPVTVPTEVPTEATTEPEAEADTMSIVKQLMFVGLSADEAQEMGEIFENVGLTDIGMICFGPGSGINDLQAFIAPVFGSKQLQVNFTVENRMLCWVELAGIPAHKTKFHVNVFGKPGTKEELTMTSVTLFDRWEADGENYKTLEESYVAKLDYENWTITRWEHP